MNRISKLLVICCAAVLVSGCGDGEPEQTREDIIKRKELIKQVNASGKITDKQAEFLGSVKGMPSFNGFTLSALSLNGLTFITDAPMKKLDNIVMLSLDGLTSITDAQAESLGKVSGLFLNGLTSLTDQQAKSLSKVEFLRVSKDLQPLIDKYKKQ